ncbi:nucleoside recognition domain-containing protein [Apibacter sp. HY039]|uniref:nucleoside recognition domain-containing protein n=1 Tax=Apibacter sp. HY039 TaxID=2501476 RepID=UPI001C880AC8|nr:nucleoside recognition domain-containing protein [Apibacter sp. HY039]
MTLNYIWIAFIILSFIVGLIKLIFLGDTVVFKHMVDGLFDTTKVAVMDIALPLAGMMTFWLGIMKIGENAGAIRFLSKIVSPFFTKLFPSVPKDHPAIGNMMMNFSANLLGLDNAATPLGLKAMDSLQTLNPKKDTATDAQIMFLVLHTSGLTLIPATIMLYRYLNGAQDPTDIFIPCIIGTFCTTLFGIIIVGIKQKLNLINPTVIAGLGISVMMILGLSYYMKNSAASYAENAISYTDKIDSQMRNDENITVDQFKELYPESFRKEIKIDSEKITPEIITKTNNEYINFERGTSSRVMSNLLLLLIPTIFITGGFIKKINVFDSFIDGAKDGFGVAVKIISYLIAMLAAISLLRNSGIMDYILAGIAYLFHLLDINTDFIPALPTALMKPLSGSGSRALMIETMQNYGADSFAGRLACIFQGSADTTFYIIALYFGSVGIKRIRYAITAGLLTELLGVITAILIAYYFFG